MDWTLTDRALQLPDDNELTMLAGLMDDVHQGQPDPTAAWREPSHRLIGLAGERQVARYLRVPMDTTVKPEGSARANLVLSSGVPVDVVTRTRLRFGGLPDLTLKVRDANKSKQDMILVLAMFKSGGEDPELLGWAWQSKVVKTGIKKTFTGKLENYILRVDQLEPMHLLFTYHTPAPLSSEEQQAVKEAA